jgi:hypothetical protein
VHNILNEAISSRLRSTQYNKLKALLGFSYGIDVRVMEYKIETNSKIHITLHNIVLNCIGDQSDNMDG